MRERVLWSLLAVLTACANESDGDSGDDGTESSSGGEPVDVEAVRERALGFREELEQVTVTPRSSQHGLADTVHVWIDPGAAQTYRALDPGADEAEQPAFAPGTLFVKEHLDAQGAEAGLTMMFRGPSGYAPDAADWWWGRTDAQGKLQDEGQVAFCIGCHAGANAEAFVFGVDAANQTSD